MDYVTAPFTILVDTREQHPFGFRDLTERCRKNGKQVTLPLFVDTEDATLKSGDYSIQGYEDRVAVERKSQEDLFSSLTWGRERFVKEMIRLSEMDVAWVVVEGGWRSILERQDTHSRANPLAIYHTVASWQSRYPTIQWWACDTRRFAEKTTFYLLSHWYELNKPGGILEKEASGKKKSLHVTETE